jgi:hypothetical protein
METVDDEIRDLALKFIEKAKADGKPFFLWLNPTRMHIVTHLSPKYEALRNSKNGWSIHEAGMAQLDDDVGLVMKKLKDMGVDDNTIVVFTTDNGTEVFTWPDGGQTPFAQSKGTVFEGGFRVPAMIRWPGKVPAGEVENGIISGLDWFPTFLAAAGNPNIVAELKQGKQIGDTTYKVHLDGYDQTNMITGKGPSNRHEVWYFGESELGAVRIDDYKYRFIDQPGGWLGDKTKPDVPYLINLRLDPFERTGWPDSGTKFGAQQYFDWFKYEFWRFVFVQQQVEKLAMTAVEFPPMQKGASWRTGRVRLAGWSPARLAASVLLLSRTAGPPQLVRPLPVALARLPALDRLMPTDCMGGREPLQYAAVAQRFLRRNLKRDRRQAAAGSAAQRKRARTLSENAEPGSLPVEHFDPTHMPIGIWVELDLGLACGPGLRRVDDAGSAANPHRRDRRGDLHVASARHLAGEEAGGAARDREQGGVCATALLIDKFVNGDARIGTQAEGGFVVEGDTKRGVRRSLEHVVLKDKVVDA